MAITMRQITGVLNTPADEVPARGRVAFTMTGFDVEGVEVIAAGRIEAVLDDTGALDVELWAAEEGDAALTYGVELIYFSPGAKTTLTVDLGVIYVTSGAGALNLTDLLSVPPPAPVTTDVLAEVIALAAAADADRIAAAASAVAAEAAEVAAEAAEASAEAAAADVQTMGAARAGFAREARNTWNTLANWSGDYIGTNGVGGTAYLPRSLTASQTGTTVTASTAIFEKLYVGCLIKWASGEEAVVTAVNTVSPSWPEITTCTVDRSQTVASGAATIRAKHLVGITYGDSVGNRVGAILARSMWRAIGFGGLILQANNIDTNFGSQTAAVTFAGGAADDSSDTHFPDYPWGARWSLPSGGTITFGLLETYSAGVSRAMRHVLAPEEKKHDTCVIVWRRAAGAFTVERRRFHDALWEAVETVADASAGSATWAHRVYSHDLRSDWEYRITGTSGTVYFQSAALRNDSAPGFVYWPLSRGGELISDFAQISSAELAELCAIYQQPDFRIVFSYDTVPGDTDAADYLPELTADRALWATAAPRCDHVWMTGWEATSDQAEQVGWNDAVEDIALSNGDSLVPLYDLFGDYAASGSLLGWVDDGVHPSIKGEVIIGHALFRALGLADHPTIREFRDVSAYRGAFANLSVLGRSVPAQIAAVRQRVGEPQRGARWLSGTCRLWADDILPAALGTGDFTIHLDVTLPTSASAVNSLFVVSSSALATATAGELLITLESPSWLRIYLRNGGGTTYEYRYQHFLTAYGGQRGVLTIRSDRAKNRFDIFWNGEPAQGADGTVSGAGDNLAAWTGTGTEVGMIGAVLDANSVSIFGVMMWASRLTDAEIMTTIEADAPAIAPLFWWDFSEGVGRMVRDHSGNGRHALWSGSGGSQYSASTGPTWRYPKNRLSPLAKEFTIASTTVLMPGDDIVAAYSANRDMLLPASAAVGDTIKITVNSASTIRITQNASQQIKSGASATTVGTGGRVTIPNATAVTLRCVTGGTSTVWVVEALAGAALTWV